jgi:hypothetical protein
MLPSCRFEVQFSVPRIDVDMNMSSIQRRLSMRLSGPGRLWKQSCAGCRYSDAKKWEQTSRLDPERDIPLVICRRPIPNVSTQRAVRMCPDGSVVLCTALAYKSWYLLREAGRIKCQGLDG